MLSSFWNTKIFLFGCFLLQAPWTTFKVVAYCMHLGFFYSNQQPVCFFQNHSFQKSHLVWMLDTMNMYLIQILTLLWTLEIEFMKYNKSVDKKDKGNVEIFNLSEQLPIPIIQPIDILPPMVRRWSCDQVPMTWAPWVVTGCGRIPINITPSMKWYKLPTTK